MAGSGNFSRRDFIKITTAAVGMFIGAAIGLPAIAYLIDPALKATKSDAWIPLGKVETFEVGKPILASFTRTHLGCSVSWKADRQEFVCPCHDAQFGLDGSVRGGPPPRPLDSFSGNRLKVENGILMLHFLEG